MNVIHRISIRNELDGLFMTFDFLADLSFFSIINQNMSSEYV